MNSSYAHKSYDVFISYNSEGRLWVEVLARNLQQHGYKVWLDIWNLVPGHNFVAGLHEGLKHSRKGILVVTAEAIHSGWVREEYYQMMAQKHNGSDFTIIPVLLGQELPDLPFLCSVHVIDFRNPDKYSKAFYHLLCALEDKAPGPNVELTGELEIPNPLRDSTPSTQNSEQSFVDEVCGLLYQSFFQALVLLAQADRGQETLIQAILSRVKNVYGAERVLHIMPPCSPRTSLPDYFRVLGKQCNSTVDITSSVCFQGYLEQWLTENRRMFLLISGFESGSDEGREELAGCLRSLNERYPETLHIVICGGEKLAGLYYSGTLSYLNNAEVREYPELALADVHGIQHRMYPGRSLGDRDAQMLLKISGGHPRLLRHCLRVWEKGLRLEECQAALMEYPMMWQIFMGFANEPILCELLKVEDLGPYQPYLNDPLLRRLYWKNLLTKRNMNRRQHLVWRCDAIRKVGQEILECHE